MKPWKESERGVIPSATIHMKCQFIDEHGGYCGSEQVSGGYCMNHHPSLVIESYKRNLPVKNKVTVIPPKRDSAVYGASIKRNKGSQFLGDTVKARDNLNKTLADLDRKYGATRLNTSKNKYDTWLDYGRNADDGLFDDKDFAEFSKEEWAEFDAIYGSKFQNEINEPKYVPPPPVHLKVGEYRLVSSADPSEKEGKFHIPHMQYFVLRTSKGYRAVWVSHCGMGVRGSRPTAPLFNHHWSKAHETYRKAEDEFWRGGESPFRVKSRILEVADENRFPPNARKLAKDGKWDILKSIDTPEEMIKRLTQWKKDGCPGWRTYTPGKGEEVDVTNWAEKYKWKR